jgi:hypothetical protein
MRVKCWRGRFKTKGQVVSKKSKKSALCHVVWSDGEQPRQYHGIAKLQPYQLFDKSAYDLAIVANEDTFDLWRLDEDKTHECLALEELHRYYRENEPWVDMGNIRLVS